VANDQEKVLKVLQQASGKSVLLDEVVSKAGLSAGVATSALVMLELQGKARQVPGGRWVFVVPNVGRPKAVKPKVVKPRVKKKAPPRRRSSKPKAARRGVTKQKICQPCRTVRRDMATGKFKAAPKGKAAR
jgi:hypothetical protein